MQNKSLARIVKNSLLIAIALPVLINLLMFFRVLPVSGDEKTWISTLGTFWGSISGGLISGAITYFGVKMTIDSSENEINKSINEQRRIREEELLVSTSKERLLNLYHPLDVLHAEYIFQYGAHSFNTLKKSQQDDYVNLINRNSVYGDSVFYVAFIELKWAMKGDDYDEADERYAEINNMVTNEVMNLRKQIKLPELYTFYT
ncbi:hypothetical protein D5E69_14275 [Rossellomorea marisflavi]|uniref:hypothetical protein n=1 Tax=Rossellomorea marisflavi TaxID=189381 RepID=UPI0013171587|nr:hypothetical protein [Rossellomorea marisflavi]QHA36865.1 hypothetical protein D5E69_14275 [Rossellomorea marisflavi]